MNRMKRLVALVLLLAAVAPAVPVFAIEVTPTRTLCRWVTQMGAGPTEEDAYDNALYQLRLDYYVFRYTREGAGCPDEDDVDAPGPIEVPLVCWAEIRACVLSRPSL